MKRACVMVTIAGVLGLIAACSDETIVLATVAEEDDAGMIGRHMGAKCTDTSQCQAGEFCLLDHPEIPAGRCKHKPLICSIDKFEPVCGASGISYFSDCYRQRAGESTATPGECVDNPRICDQRTMFCPTGATCDLLGSGLPSDKTCGLPAGRCWGIISKCPPPDPDDHDGWDECSTEGGALRCVDICTAIQTGLRFTRHDHCR